MNLFEITPEYKVQIDPIAYNIIPFKQIWNRDKSKSKDTAKAELTYVALSSDYKSPFFNQPDLEIRESTIREHCFGVNSKWEPDKLVNSAVEFYKDTQRTVSLTLLEDAMAGISKLSTYLRNINFDEIELNEKTGKITPKHDIKKYADTIKTIPAILDSLKTLQEAVRKEQEASKSLRGGREKGMYAD